MDKRLHKMRGVWATAFGHKISSGESTNQVCFTVFTSHKLKESTLSKSDIVPKIVSIGGKRYPTDIIQMGQREILQSKGNPNSAHLIADQMSRSTLSGYVRDNNRYYALSCAHCMKGPDGNPNNDQLIEVHNAKTEQWTRLGDNIRAIYGKGSGKQYDYGFSDAAIVRIEHPEAAQLLRSLGRKSIQSVRRQPRSEVEAQNLISKKVIGTGARMGTRTAEVSNIYFRSLNSGRYVDISIMRKDEGPLTVEGDSGAVWYLENGQALAIHAIGKTRGKSRTAYASFCVFMSRVMTEFDTELLEK